MSCVYILPFYHSYIDSFKDIAGSGLLIQDVAGSMTRQWSAARHVLWLAAKHVLSETQSPQQQTEKDYWITTCIVCATKK